jgi:hypothetical protein
MDVAGRPIRVETSVEIVAKKVRFRARDFKARAPRTPMPDRPAQRTPKLTELIRVREFQITASERANQCLPIPTAAAIYSIVWLSGTCD